MRHGDQNWRLCHSGDSSRQQQRQHSHRIVQPFKSQATDGGSLATSSTPSNMHTDCELPPKASGPPSCFGITTSPRRTFNAGRHHQSYSPATLIIHQKKRLLLEVNLNRVGTGALPSFISGHYPQQFGFLRTLSTSGQKPPTRTPARIAPGTSILIAQATSEKSLLRRWNDPALHRRSLSSLAQPHLRRLT